MDLLFAIKKILGVLLMPSASLFFIFILAWLIYLKGKPTLAKCLGVLSIVFFYLISITPVSNFLLKPLELEYPAYAEQPVQYVVVLGGWHFTSSERPLSSQLSSVSLNRLTEGLMIYRANPGAKLLLSGYKASDTVSHAKTAAKVAMALGIPEEDIVLAEHPKDTAEEALHWVEYTGGDRFALVTTASHMPRAVYLFEKAMTEKNIELQSLIPAPTNYRACVEQCYRFSSWIPKGRNIEKVDSAWHEYLGLMWARLQN